MCNEEEIVEEGCCACEDKQLALEIVDVMLEKDIITFKTGNNDANVVELMKHFKVVYDKLGECQCECEE
jgi:hypothetical protein